MALLSQLCRGDGYQCSLLYFRLQNKRNRSCSLEHRASITINAWTGDTETQALYNGGNQCENEA